MPTTDQARAALDAARERKRDAVRAWITASDAGNRAAARAADQRSRYWDARIAERFEALHPVLAVDVESIPMLEGWNRPVADRYRNTPMWVPRRGLSVHVGGGMFVSVCAECDHAVRHIGPVPRYATTGSHEVDAHGAQVPGINVGMLP